MRMSNREIKKTKHKSFTFFVEKLSRPYSDKGREEFDRIFGHGKNDNDVTDEKK